MKKKSLYWPFDSIPVQLNSAYTEPLLKKQQQTILFFLCTFFCFVLCSCTDFVESLQLLVNDVWKEKFLSFLCTKRILAAISKLKYAACLYYVQPHQQKILNWKTVIHPITSMATSKQTYFRTTFLCPLIAAPVHLQVIKILVLKGKLQSLVGKAWGGRFLKTWVWFPLAGGNITTGNNSPKDWCNNQRSHWHSWKTKQNKIKSKQQ